LHGEFNKTIVILKLVNIIHEHATGTHADGLCQTECWLRFG